MKVIYLISVLILLVFTNDLQAQTETCTYTVSGKILDIDTKEPIPFVTVKVKDTDAFTVTGLNGEFAIDGLCSSQNTLIISCYGYCDSICEQNHQHGKMPHIYLRQEVVELGEVVIMAEGIEKEGTASFSQQTLNKTTLANDPTQSLASALSAIEGVNMVSTGTNIQLPVIHGLYGNRILILNNGIKHSFQNWGTDHAPEIDISAAHNVTVYKGAAGVRFGPEALGGAVAVEPNPLYFNSPLFANLGTGYQTNGKGVFTTLEAGQGYKHWSWFAGGSYTKIGDRHAPDYNLTNTGKEEKSLSAGIRYQSDNWDFKVYYSFVDQDLALLRASVAESGNAFIRAINSDRPLIILPFSYAINEPNQLTQHQFGKAEINWSYSDDAMLTFRAGRQFNKRKEFDVRRNSEKPILDLDLTTYDFQLDWIHPNWKKLEGLIGLQVFTQDNNNIPGTGTTPYIPNYNTIRYSGFIIENFRSGKQTYEIGLRIDNEYTNVRGRETDQELFTDAYSFTNVTSSIGMVREISDNSTFRSNLGSSWRTPNMAELYSYGQHGFKTAFGLLRYYYNEEGELRTDEVIKMDESNVASEKGFKWINEWVLTKPKSTYTTTAYAQYIENFIFQRPYGVIGTIRGPMPVFIYDQANALLLGIDFTWQKNWSRRIDGTFGLSCLYSKNVEDNEPLINQPPVNINYQLDYKRSRFWIFESSQFTMGAGYTFKQYQAPQTIPPESLIDGSVVITPETEIFDFKEAPDGYFLMDVGWAFNAGKFNGSIEIKNVLNKSFRNYLDQMRYFADEPGRNFLFSINYMFNSK